MGRAKSVDLVGETETFHPKAPCLLVSGVNG